MMRFSKLLKVRPAPEARGSARPFPFRLRQDPHNAVRENKRAARFSPGDR